MTKPGIVLLLGLLGCKKPGAEDALAKLVEITHRMCACTDRPCLDRTDAEMTEPLREITADEADTKLDEAAMRQLTAVMSESTNCRMKLGEAADRAAKEHFIDRRTAPIPAASRAECLDNPLAKGC
jgi:hypothetical protein